MYMLKSEVFPSFILIIMGSIDCLTTVIGVLYFGAIELNPFLAGIVSTNILAFLAIKVSATLFIGFTYIQANKTLNKTMNKNTKSFKYSHGLVKIAYACLLAFLIVVVVNNLSILLS
jgi:4-amino-4-deoxy-L-arabinose transferase-like glycosyltransferase